MTNVNPLPRGTRRTLSAHALDALQEFYSDRDTRAKEFEELRAAAEEREAAGREKEAALVYPLSMATFGEDWNKSQFWVRRLFLFYFFVLCPGFRACPHGVRVCVYVCAYLQEEYPADACVVAYSARTRRRTSMPGSSWTGPRPRPASPSCRCRVFSSRSRTFL